MCCVVFTNNQGHYEATLLPDVLHLVSSKHVAHGKKTHTLCLKLPSGDDDPFESASHP